MHALEHGKPCGRPAEDLNQLHGGQDQCEALAGREGARVGAEGGHTGRPLLQRAEQLGVGVERVDVVSRGVEVASDPAGARPEIEDRSARVGRECAPQFEIGRVGAVLDVVPDDLPGGQSDHLFARPRRAKRSRRSRSAV